MRIRFWGTRGSIAKPGFDTLRYGGNTSCVELLSDAGTRVVLDCGTGAYGLGTALLGSGERPIVGHLLIGHTHWDHIQGLPFFAPLFVPGNRWDIHAPKGLARTVRDALAGQMQETYFPVSLEQLGATLAFHDLVEGSFQLGEIRVTAHYLNHPAVTLGYRLEVGGVSVVYATDHEPHARRLAAVPAAGESLPRIASHGEDARHAQFLGGADLVIHDAQYLATEYPAKVGWGHSTVEYVVALASAAAVKRLALFHHDPMRSDAELDAVVERARALAGSVGTLEVFAAAEGNEVLLPEEARSRAEPVAQRRGMSEPTCARLALVSASASVDALAEQALEGQGFNLVRASFDEAAAIARERTPALGLVECGPDASERVRELRKHGNLGPDVPLVVLATAGTPIDPESVFAAGATDLLTMPVSMQFLRARLGTWLLRTRARWAQPPLHPQEALRLEAIATLGLTPTPEERFDALTRLAARALDAPIAGIGIVDRDRQWMKSSFGAPGGSLPRDITPCAYTVLQEEPLAFSDDDPLYGDNPGLRMMGMRFYAGVAVHGRDRLPVGTICVYDRRPRELSPEDLQLLRDLGGLVERELATGVR